MLDQQQQLPAEAIAALERGQTIEAIKHVRMASGMGLKEAKDAVDLYVKNNPDVKKSALAPGEVRKGGGLKWLVVLILLALGAYFLLAGG